MTMMNLGLCRKAFFLVFPTRPAGKSGRSYLLVCLVSNVRMGTDLLMLGLGQDQRRTWLVSLTIIGILFGYS